jgi:hypothetical protein
MAIKAYIFGDSIETAMGFGYIVEEIRCRLLHRSIINNCQHTAVWNMLVILIYFIMPPLKEVRFIIICEDDIDHEKVSLV